MTLFVTFEEVDGEWVMADSFLVCVGPRGSCWPVIETVQMSGQVIASPTASPAASPVATEP
ncbi:MAG: hypothetical protein H0V37_08990 [Chloroflexia bacterium]|nr:hypothetical protein [Chloroflexia bacterium]